MIIHAILAMGNAQQVYMVYKYTKDMWYCEH